ncbi:MAG: aa3-type cytochrome oxidase subunit CtaJ [Haloechinothrix sp.]
MVIGYPADVSVIETVLVYVGIPLALYGLVSLLTLRSKFVSTPRYRPGQEWHHAPVWWTANPDGLDRPHAEAASGSDSRSAPASVRGGARGSW